ncbi:helix-turn-helix domain-containing protein [Atlantibacter hermannii]|uniref:helix-turn-helix domain-containing protein n=2 Tax=Atlantibacter TaxID=1903434 RepID=UPI0022B7CC18|nr:helix-turn-helix domain-containing protein [Atlantibacter hermannii]MCZ7833939.1 helix-turn-helix domain-containing protein [Atlantibacter hermannii]
MSENSLRAAVNNRSPHAAQLIDSLKPYPSRHYPRGTRLDFIQGGVKVCHIMESGIAELRRSVDQILIVRLTAPTVLGIAVSDAYLVVKETATICTLPQEEVLQRIEERGLWELLARHMMVQTNKIYLYSNQISAPTSYELVRKQLIELINEPESLRNSISVERYIRDKVHLSRTCVMKILSDLKTGGYIVIEVGRLKEIKHLPLKY